MIAPGRLAVVDRDGADGRGCQLTIGARRNVSGQPAYPVHVDGIPAGEIVRIRGQIAGVRIGGAANPRRFLWTVCLPWTPGASYTTVHEAAAHVRRAFLRGDWRER